MKLGCALGARMRLLALVAMTLALAGCAAVPSEVPATVPEGRATPQADRAAQVAEVYNYKVLSGYSWNGKVYTDSRALFTAIEGQAGADWPKLPKLDSTGAALRVLAPSRLSAQSVAASANLRLAELRVEALRASRLFTALRAETDGAGKFQARGGDYVLRYDGAAWTLKDGEDRETGIGVATTLPGFVANVDAGVQALRADAEFLRVIHPEPGRPDVVRYRGQAFPGLVPVVDAFDRVNAELAAQVTPAVRPVGGRALLVLPRHAPDVPYLLPGERPGLTDAARKAYRQALDRRFARFVVAAKVFAEVKVIHGDEVGAVADGVDWVLWRAPNGTVWTVRTADGDSFDLPLSVQPQGFATALAEALLPPPDPAVPDEPAAGPAGPLPANMAPSLYVR